MQTLVVPLFQDVVDHPTAPFRWARVELSDPNLQITSARLLAKANMRGLAYLMYHWYLSSFVVGVYVTAGASAGVPRSGLTPVATMRRH
jgi:hypothetical protein